MVLLSISVGIAVVVAPGAEENDRSMRRFCGQTSEKPTRTPRSGTFQMTRKIRTYTWAHSGVKLTSLASAG
jgi:hypothetical protein